MISVAVKDKRHRRLNRRLSSSSSDALGFHNSKIWTSTASALVEPAVRAVVHLTPMLNHTETHQEICFNTRSTDVWNSVVDPTLVFNLYKDTLSGRDSAPDKLTVHQSIALVYFLVQLAPTAIWLIERHRMNRRWTQGELSVHPTILLFRETFPTSSLPC
jgi:hypothetical protein